MNKLINDDACIAEWRAMLKIFHETIKGDPAPEKVKNELAALKEAAKVAKNLTFHQVTAIQARCDNYMNGEYGNTKTAEHISQAHNFSTNGKLA